MLDVSAVFWGTSLEKHITCFMLFPCLIEKTLFPADFHLGRAQHSIYVIKKYKKVLTVQKELGHHR